MIKVFCLKCDKKYDRKFVTRLKDSVNKHLTKKHEFFCVTDKPEENSEPTQPPMNPGMMM